MASLEDKDANLRQRVGTVETKLTGISGALIEIKSDLKWLRRVGWAIVGAFVAAFMWTLTFYIPDKITDKVATIDNKIPTNFSERFAKMETNLQNMQDRLNRLTPAALNDLIPSPNSVMSPAMVTARLRKASRVVDVALKTEIPAAPESLAPLLRRVDDIRQRYSGNSQIRVAADSIGVRLAGYELVSRKILTGLPMNTPPETSQNDQSKGIPMFRLKTADYSSFTGGGTFSCSDRNLRFVEFTQTDPATVLFMGIHIKTCAQRLDGPRWINVNFSGSDIEYNGGPLYLADVKFENCKFNFGSDPNSKAALATIIASKEAPVSLLIPR